MNAIQPVDVFAQDGAAVTAPLTERRRATDVTPRELFYEILALALAGLYTKVPLGAPLFDRNMIRSVTGHMTDNDAGRLVMKAEDWVRQENIVRAQEGQKSSSASAATLAALESGGSDGALGERLERAARGYAGETPSPDQRRETRQLAAEFLKTFRP